MAKLVRIIFIFLLFLFLSKPSFAQDVEEAIAKDAEEIKDQGIEEGVFLESAMYYLPSSSAQSMNGHVGLVDAKDQIRYSFKLFDQLPIEVGLEGRYISIKKDVHVPLPSKLTGMASYMETTLPFFNVNNTYLRLGVGPSFYTDNWAAYSSAFRIPSWACAIYKYSPELMLIIGVAYLPDYELEACPLVGVIYNPNDRLSISILPWKDSEISYKVNDVVTLFMQGNFTADEFEVNRDGSRGVVLCYQDIKMGTGVRFKINKYMTAGFAVGSVFYRSLYYRDSNGKVIIDGGLYTNANMSIKF